MFNKCRRCGRGFDSFELLTQHTLAEHRGEPIGIPLPQPGDRVELVSTDDEGTLLVPGDAGTVDGISLGGDAVFVNWDSGSRLGLLVGIDEWKVL